jgi:hypothetical protein
MRRHGAKIVTAFCLGEATLHVQRRRGLSVSFSAIHLLCTMAQTARSSSPAGCQSHSHDQPYGTTDSRIGPLARQTGYRHS